MPNSRSDWHERVKAVEGEYKAVRFAVDRLRHLPIGHIENREMADELRKVLRNADRHLEGTYVVRLFAAFEAALRSYDRARHNDPTRNVAAAALIDSTGGRRGQGISAIVRQQAHSVRNLRNYWAHDTDRVSEQMTISEARHRLQMFLRWLPEQW
jgi:hypothetical protein